MKIISAKVILTTALIALPIFSGAILTGCTTTNQQESTGQFVDSSVITTKVKAKLLVDEGIHGLPITVKTYKDTVQLSGFVNNNYQKNKAEEITKSVEGVGAVENSLIVKPH
ncbi:MAG: BON domain-containing protein [Gammaproteobacteria bacterium]|nr:BON domain-containing protein [Gammaproteobacteria bacterium]